MTTQEKVIQHKETKRGSVLPVLTNRWLQVNDVPVELDVKEKVSYQGANPEAPLVSDFDQKVTESGHGISQEILQENRDFANFEQTISVHHGDHKRVDLPLSEKMKQLVDRHYVTTEPGHCGSLIIQANSEDDTEANRNGVIYVDVAEDAIIRLVVVNRLNAKSKNNQSIIANVRDGGILHLVQVELGSERTNLNYACDLSGYESMTTAYCAYIASKEEEIDLFYNIKHIAPYSNSDIQVNGVLLDQAKKSFRGTIDFLKGSVGSKGNEEEFAILMSDEAKSIAVPLLLSGESDVEGNHAASAGRLDSDILFYIMSRGLDEKQAESLVVEARMSPTLDRVQDEVLRKELKKEIHERILHREK